MAIHVSCPQCQTSFTLPDASRGKQVRCKECFQVFHAGGEPADGPAAPPPPPAPTPKPAAKPVSKLAAKPAPARPAAAARPAPAQKKAAPVAKRPQPVNALDFSAADDHPTTSHYRRRRGWGGVIAVLVLFFLLLLGGGAAAVGVLAYLGKLPPQLAALLPINAPQAQAKPVDAATPDKDGVSVSTPPKSDKPDPPKPDKPDPPKPDNPQLKPDNPQPKPPDEAPLPKPDLPAGPPAVKVPPPAPPDKNAPAGKDDDPVNQANFDKISKDLTEKDLTHLLGAERGNIPGPDGRATLCWATTTVNANIVVEMKDGKVIDKRSSMLWPVKWSAAVAEKPPPPPPPDKPTGSVTKENFDKIARGMTEIEVTDLLGPPSTNQNRTGAADRDNCMSWSDAGVKLTCVVFVKGKVTSKRTDEVWPVVYPGDPLNQENFNKVAKGMTEKDVTDLLGPAPFTKKAAGNSPDGADAIWVWADLPDEVAPGIYVAFSQGKVVRKWTPPTGQGWPVVYPGESLLGRLLKQNFDKIAKGMTEKEVTALLGPPTSTNNIGPVGIDYHLRWDGAGLAVTDVYFVKGRVTEKKTTEGWPVVYPGEVAAAPDTANPPARTVGKLMKIESDMTSIWAIVQSEDGKQAKVAITDAKVAIDGKAAKPADLPPGCTVVISAYSDTGAAELTVRARTRGAVSPPDKGAGLDALVSKTKELFDKVAKGMSKDDVVKLLGPPGDESSLVDPKGVKVAFLKWNDGKNRVEIVLNDDKVVDKSNEQNWPVVYPGGVAVNPPPPDKDPMPPAPKPAELTKDLFDKIAKGMSKDALTALLGPPAQVQANPQPGVEERLIWAGPGGKVMVSMAGGKTLFKFTTQNWPVVYP